MATFSLSPRFFVVASLLASLGAEVAHATEVHNPHTDRRERNERILREAMETRQRQCRVTGRAYSEYDDIIHP